MIRPASLRLCAALALVFLGGVALAQPEPAAPTPAPAPVAAEPAPADQKPAPPPADPPQMPPTGDRLEPPPAPLCRLAQQPEVNKAGEPNQPTVHSPMRQVCEDELAKDHDWWFNLQGRLRNNIHEQAAKEITTNNRHVVAAYAAMWLIAIVFVIYLWMRQQRLKGEVARLAAELARIEADDQAAARSPGKPGADEGAP